MKKIFILIIANALIFFTYNAFAYKVIKVKNKKLLITFSPSETPQVKDTFYVINNKGKKKAIISIIKVKGSKAIAKILKGKAQAGWSLRVRKRSQISKASPTESHTSENNTSSNSYSASYTKKQKKLFNHLSFLWGVSLNSLKTNSSQVGSLTHSDTSFFNFETSTTFFLPNKPIFGLKILSNSENFTLKATCTNSGSPKDKKDCNANIVYLGGGALAIVQVPLTSKLSVWAGLGGKLLIPISKEITKLTNITEPTTGNAGDVYQYLDEKSIKLTSALLISGGLTFNFNPKFSIPINASYTKFPSSTKVEAHSIINFQTGLVYHF